MFVCQGHRNSVSKCIMQAPCQVIFGIMTVRVAQLRWRRGPGSFPPMPALSDSSTTVSELRERVLAFVRERDWEQFHSPKNLSMALSAEAAELMEHFLWASPEESRTVARWTRRSGPRSPRSSPTW
jgi:hypothetical protein